MNGQHSNDDNQNSDRLVIRKRIINHRNKQIETRIKRKIILEDGIIISDSGPLVTTKTIEDTKQEFEEFGPFTNGGVGQNNRQDRDDTNIANDNIQKVNKTKSQVPDSYLFGYGDHQIASCSSSAKTKPNFPTYYFGQTKIKNSDKKVFNEISDGGNRTMWQQNVATINHQKKDNHGNQFEADDFHERDCQYIYEYGDLHHHKSTGSSTSFAEANCHEFSVFPLRESIRDILLTKLLGRQNISCFFKIFKNFYN